VFARGALKKLWREGLAADEAVLCAVQSLYDAADEDSATGGPDLARRLYPVVATVTGDGYRRLPDEEVGAVVDAVVQSRLQHPEGPPATLQ
jgi:proteasome beta subunit